MSTEYISERLIEIGVKEANKIINFIQVYAPRNDMYSDEEKESFYQDPSDLIKSIPNKDMHIMEGFTCTVSERRKPWTKHP